MHKKFLGMLSLAMAGVLVAGSLAPANLAFAADEELSLTDVAEEEAVLLESDGDEDWNEGSEEPGEQPIDNPEEPVPAEESTLKFVNRWNSNDTCGNKITFAGQYQEFVYEFPEGFETAVCNTIVVKVADQGNNVCFKLYDSGMNEMQANYSNSGSTEYEVVPKYDGDVKYLGVMSMASGEENYPYSITIKEINPDLTATGGEEETITYGPESMKFSQKWSGAEVEKNTLTFVETWDEYWFHLNRKFDAEKIKSITVKTSGQTASLAFKIYDDAGKELQAFYGKNNSNEYVIYPSATGTVTDFAFMAGDDNKSFPVEATIESVVFVEDTAVEEPSDNEVEYDIVNLRDEVAKIMGDDFIIGTAISYMEFADAKEMALVTKHFNGCTLGNELKPDSMIVKDVNKVKSYELNGEEVLFPELNFETPERYLDFFLDWNNEHPDKFIKIRGHVLVWHSQTPELIFHEDFDTNKPYVTPDVMNKRLEVYIREVANHFTAPDSKYKDLFYGWDVVNEAVSDGTGTYRNGNENSSWWRVYNSPEFIQNAFVYANKYYPANISLFYNDYNDTMTNKVNGICKLLEDVKATPGARIDGFGMQAHYQIANNDPSMEAFRTAAKRYAAIVDQVQVTELDFKGSRNSTDERLAKRYKDLYDTIRRLKDEGVNITGMTIWGVVDKHSWLQTANSAGGGASGNARQYPLLFDDHYKAKNAFYAIANPGELMPEVRNVTLLQLQGDDFDAGQSYDFKTDAGVVSFVPMWEEGGLAVRVEVEDTTVDDTDKITLYATDGSIKKTVVERSAATVTNLGYAAVLKLAVDNDKLAANQVKLDVVVTDGEKDFAFGDTQLKQGERSDYYAETVIKPLLAVKNGTVKVDAQELDAAWEKATPFVVAINGGAQATATAKALWDEENLYVLAEVQDSLLNKDASDAWEQDSVEIFVDENNAKASSYEEDDKQYRISYVNELSFNGTKCVAENIDSDVFVTDDGYRVVAALKWTDIAPAAGSKVGLDIQINDADASGKRVGTLNWADNTGNGWSSPAVFGTIVLTQDEEVKGEFYTKWGSTYFKYPDGTFHVGFLEKDGYKYYFNSKGHMVRKKFVTEDDKEYYLNAEGHVVIGKFTKDKKFYYADEEGVIQKKTEVKIGADYYYFDAKGVRVDKQFVRVDENTIYYYGKDGKKWFGELRRNKSNYYYCDDATGALKLGFFDYKGHTYYFDKKDGRRQCGWITVDGKEYYALSNGVIVKNTQRWVGKYWCTFDANGVCISKKHR
ncbi:endo-1,4-beta-xylanase [Butyrivibrio sp. MC2021]|uniref:endo-1,4-beta-xylanase n=1 Tax=Butyrivibrio sp. MC2021 TaxID=1408306 RepID=UPI00047B37A2|nr:endo-1,4-beta-xylanase [Butyrivibrio sp. MC2021]